MTMRSLRLDFNEAWKNTWPETYGKWTTEGWSWTAEHQHLWDGPHCVVTDQIGSRNPDLPTYLQVGIFDSYSDFRNPVSDGVTMADGWYEVPREVWQNGGHVIARIITGDEGSASFRHTGSFPMHSVEVWDRQGVERWLCSPDASPQPLLGPQAPT